MKNTSYILLFFLFIVMKITAQNNELLVYTTKDGLPNSKITSITQDTIGYLWLTTHHKGIIRFDGNNFTKYTTKNGLFSDKTNIIIRKNDSLLIGTNKGLSIRYRNTFINLESPKINSISIVKNTVYVGTTQGIYILKKDYLLPLKIIYDIDLNQINTIKFDGNYFWIATKTALWRVNDLKKPKLIKKINNGNYTSILAFKNSILAASYEKGVKLIKNGNIVKTISTTTNINQISLVNQELWLATQDNGIEILNATNFSFVRSINKYNTNKIGNEVAQIFKDKQHNLWILGNKLYQIPSLQNKKETPQIFIEKITINYQTIDHLQLVKKQQIVQLQPKQNNISFAFKTVDINHPKNIEYRWKLNTTFSPWSKTNTINFANLKPGIYHFEAQSKNYLQQESKPVIFSFSIDTPFYKKSSFQFLAIFLFLLMTGLSISLYIKRLHLKNTKKIKQLEIDNYILSLEQKALQLQMNPHFIFNVLNGIKAYGTTGETTKFTSTITKFAKLLRNILDNSRQEEIALSKEIETLKNYIELEYQMSTNTFEYSIETNTNTIDVEEILIPPMLVQPFVENSIKHGIKPTTKNGKITITFDVKNNFLHCTIKDNGVGFYQSKQQKTQTHASVAVKVTKERIEILSNKNNFSIQEMKKDTSVKGTKVWFKIPLKTDY